MVSPSTINYVSLHNTITAYRLCKMMMMNMENCRHV